MKNTTFSSSNYIRIRLQDGTQQKVVGFTAKKITIFNNLLYQYMEKFFALFCDKINAYFLYFKSVSFIFLSK